MSGSVILSISSQENFFDYAIRIKQLKLDETNTRTCHQWIKDHSTPLTPYLETLKEIFKEQLSLKIGPKANTLPREFLDRKINRMMKIFLKDKLELRLPVAPRLDLAQRAQWDPHFHGSSLFADHFPKVRLLLPNFDKSYEILKPEHRKLDDRFDQVRLAMDAPSFATITEAGSGYDNWTIEHKEKKIIPILAHQRTIGAVCRHDVLGYDICGLEKEECYLSQKGFLQSIEGNKVVRIHMGETIIPSAGRDHIRFMLDEVQQHYFSSKPLRIGHGTHISIEEMLHVAQKGYYIEACLSSNKRTAVLDKRSDYPLGVLLLLGVNVVIGTDGGRLYSTTLPEEYAHAARNIELFHKKLNSSDEFVSLPNGDCLLYRHILPFLRKEKTVEDVNRKVTFKELGSVVDRSILEKISAETLVQNAKTLLIACYPHLMNK